MSVPEHHRDGFPRGPAVAIGWVRCFVLDGDR